jgi:hypothetical protein
MGMGWGAKTKELNMLWFKVSIGYLEKYTLLYEMLEDTEEIIRIHKSKKDKQ